MYSQRLARLSTTDKRIEDYGYQPYGSDTGGSSHWIYLRAGWKASDDSHTIHEDTVKEVMAELSMVTRCRGKCCRQEKTACT